MNAPPSWHSKLAARRRELASVNRDHGAYRPGPISIAIFAFIALIALCVLVIRLAG